MSLQTAIPLIGFGIMSGNGVPGYITLIVAVVMTVVGLGISYWRFVIQWFDGMRGRDWTTVSALIDVVSVSEQREQGRYGEQIVHYLATLTYFYRTPELQMGEYSRMFMIEAEAQAWVAPYKGKNVMVHVNPRDATKSVLRKEEL
jgi:hypothetical protein